MERGMVLQVAAAALVLVRCGRLVLFLSAMIMSTGSKSNRPAVMRKNMTRALDEFLSGSAVAAAAASAPQSAGSDVVYIGEDVEHGGYYLVTEGLKKKSATAFPS